MKFIDLNEQYQHIKNSITARIQAVIDHGQFIWGPEIAELEKQLAKRINVKHCITVSSGTTALQIALMALDIQPGDEVITSAFSFFATAETIMLLGAKPVFVDIDPLTYNINPQLIEAAITPRTKAIIPVSLYGQCADMDAINAIANQYQLSVIEDGAQSFGARYKDGFSCGLSAIGCTSFFPSKSLGAYGDGGACFTNDDQLAEAMQMIRNHGQSSRYHHVRLGINGRFDTLQAAVVLAKLEIFDEELKKREQIAAWYNEKLQAAVTVPFVVAGNHSSFAQYTIRVPERDHLVAKLAKQGIPTAIHYPKTLYQQPIMGSHLQPRTPCLEAERAACEVLSLPFHPYQSLKEVNFISEQVLASLKSTVEVE